MSIKYFDAVAAPRSSAPLGHVAQPESRPASKSLGAARGRKAMPEGKDVAGKTAGRRGLVVLAASLIAIAQVGV